MRGVAVEHADIGAAWLPVKSRDLRWRVQGGTFQFGFGLCFRVQSKISASLGGRRM